jgi:hypothetical protein
MFLRYFVFNDSVRCLEDSTYPVTQPSGGATGDVQLHNFFRSVNSLHEKTGQQQEGNEGDEAMFAESHG